MNQRIRYNWELWTNGEEHVAISGRDFNCTIPSFIAAIHNKKNAIGMEASTSVDGMSVKFQFHTKGAEA